MEIKLFGMAKELVGQKVVKLRNIKDISCVRELKEQLKKEFPALNQLPTMAIAVNVNYAQDEDIVNENDEIVVIPPVSGG